MNKVVLIAAPQIDFKTLLMSKNVLGRSLSRGLDQVGEPVGSLASFICVLDEFQNAESNLMNSLRDAGALLYHLSFTFGIFMDEGTQIEMMENTSLHFMSSETNDPKLIMMIVSGNLAQWRDCIINLSTGKESHSIRAVMNAVLYSFEKLGLGLLWHQYTKDRLADSSVRLLPRS